MTIQLKKLLLNTIRDLTQSVSERDSNFDTLSKRVVELAEENEKVKKLYLKSHAEISAMQSIIKTLAHNQAQLAADMHTIYTAIRDAGILDTDYSEVESNHSHDIEEDDDTGSGGKGGMGGMLN